MMMSTLLCTAMLAPQDCNGDAGHTLSNPAQAEIGARFDYTLGTPYGSFALLFFSLGEGPTDFAFGTLCLDFPTPLILRTVIPAGGTARIPIPVPCDDVLVGLTVYQQFLAFDLSNPANRGVSNQTSVDLIDSTSGLCDYFGDFSDISELQLNGVADTAANALRVCRQGASNTGSAFYTESASVDANTSFSTQFHFRIVGLGGDGADGMTFAIQGNDEFALGGNGSGLGFQGIANSIAIEIDNWAGGSDPDANHIGVVKDGDTSIHLATYSPSFDLEDGAVHSIWVDYDGPTDTLDVYLSEDPNVPKPATPDMTVVLDLFALVGPDAWLGFTGSCGAVTNNHIVEFWSFDLD